MIQQGVFNELVLIRQSAPGWYLSHPEDVENDIEVLLPNRYVDDSFETGQQIRVFVYTDSEDRLVATTETPNILLHDFALLKAIDKTDHGAFMDWGLQKDLFIPFSEQNRDIEAGRSYLCYMYLDDVSGRLVGSTKLDEFLHQDNLTVKKGEEVDLIIWEQTDLGYKAIVNEIHEGLIFHNEVFKKITAGDRIKGFVKNIREDNKLDISLENISYKAIEPNSQVVLDYIKSHNGFILLNDKSDPEVIKSALGMSKRNFKRAIGHLYKLKLVRIEDDGVRLLDQ